jgi:hypothetical protein
MGWFPPTANENGKLILNEITVIKIKCELQGIFLICGEFNLMTVLEGKPNRKFLGLLPKYLSV